MGIFRRKAPLAAHSVQGTRFKIRITTTDGRTFFWCKRGQVHRVEEDVADHFVAGFQPRLFQVRDDGTLHPPIPGETFPIQKVEKVRDDS